jgi:hypothetical protein
MKRNSVCSRLIKGIISELLMNNEEPTSYIINEVWRSVCKQLGTKINVMRKLTLLSLISVCFDLLIIIRWFLNKHGFLKPMCFEENNCFLYPTRLPKIGTPSNAIFYNWRGASILGGGNATSRFAAVLCTSLSRGIDVLGGSIIEER